MYMYIYIYIYVYIYIYIVCVCVCVCLTPSQLTLKTEATSDMLKRLLYHDVWFYCTPYNSIREQFLQ